MIVPSVLLTAARNGLLTHKHLSSKKTLVKQLYEHTKKPGLFKEAKKFVGFHTEFIALSVESWKKRKKELGVVLLAISIEQTVNCYYRLLLGTSNLDDAEITAAIRNLSLDAKLGWFLKLCSGEDFPIRLKKKLRMISEIRNSIVHYKAQGSPMDENTGSHDAIEKQIKALGRLNIQKFFQEIEWKLFEITQRTNKDFRLMVKAVTKLKKWSILGFQEEP